MGHVENVEQFLVRHIVHDFGIRHRISKVTNRRMWEMLTNVSPESLDRHLNLPNSRKSTDDDFFFLFIKFGLELRVIGAEVEFIGGPETCPDCVDEFLGSRRVIWFAGDVFFE